MNTYHSVIYKGKGISVNILRIFLILAIAFPATGKVYAAGVWYVSPSGSDNSDCQSSITPCATINGAVAKATSGDTIYVMEGVYTSTGTAVVLLDKSLTLSGGWNNDFTSQEGLSVLDGEAARRGMIINSEVTVYIEKFEITNAVGQSSGGGGGMMIYQATVSIIDSLIHDIQSYGGISASFADLTLIRTTIRNSVEQGVLNYVGTLRMVSSAVIGNTYGIVSNGELFIENSTISGNEHGGIALDCNGTADIRSSTVTGNHDFGLRTYWCNTAVIQNTILAGNVDATHPDCTGPLQSNGYNIIGDTTGCDFAPSTGDLINTNAGLEPLQENGGPTPTHALLSGSPAIDAGNPNGCTDLDGNLLTVDQRGEPRPVDGNGDGNAVCDMGAFEMGETAPPPNALIVASVTHDWFRGENFAPGASVTLEILEAPNGPVLWADSRPADDTGLVVVGEWEHPVDLSPGNYIVLSDGVTTKELELEDVTLDVFDPSTDYLAGTAPPTAGGRSVWVGTGNADYGCSMDVTADPDNGAWTADFSAQPCDVKEDMWSAAQVFDDDGDASEGNLPRVPYFTVFPEWEAVEGWNWTQAATVHLEIDDPATPQSPDHSQDADVVPTPWNPNEVWVRIDFGGVYDVKPGDHVTLSEGATSQTHTVRNLAITGVDAAEDTISGTADEGAIINVWPHYTGQQLQVTAGSDKTWQLDFTGTSDLMPGENGRAQINDEFRNGTAVDWHIPNPHIVIFPVGQWYEGLEWPDGATVNITVEGKPACETSKESWGGYFSGNFAEGCEVLAGDKVTFDDGTTSRTHTVQNLAITEVDQDANTLVGTADTGATVYASVWGYTDTQVTADDGQWLIDFGVLGVDLVEGMSGRTAIRDGSGNETAVDWHIPKPRMVVFPEWEWLDGLDWPDGPVEITVADKPECATTKESQGGFFNGNFGEGCDVVVGDRVTFDDGATSRTHTVLSLAVTDVNEADDIVAGTADEGATVYVWPHATGQQLQAVAETGSWQVDFTGIFDLVPGEAGRSQVLDEFENATAVDWFVPWAAQTYTVNTTDDIDDGSCDETHCSLKEAINIANARAAADTIAFNIPGEGPFTIRPEPGYNHIEDTVTIDGTTQPGYAGTPLIELDGTYTGFDANGLVISTSDSTIKGLAINRFGGNGIIVFGNRNTIQANYIGTDVTGTTIQGPAGQAVGEYTVELMEESCPTYPTGTNFNGFVSASDDPLAPWSEASVHFVGTEECGSPEMIGAASLIYRYRIEFTEDTELTSIVVSGAAFNGPDSVLRVLDADRNVLASAPTFGGNMYTTPAVTLQGVVGKVFYVDEFDTSGGWRFRQSIVINGGLPLGNHQMGVMLTDGAADNLITDNLISGNLGDGVMIANAGTTGNTVQGNLIGTDVYGTDILSNNGAGVWVGAGASDNLIGGTGEGDGNLISGSGTHGVSINHMETTGTKVFGNKIGTNLTGDDVLPNGAGGVYISGSQTWLGGTEPGTGNLISGNKGDGVAITERVSQNIVQGNLIGTDVTGTTTIGTPGPAVGDYTFTAMPGTCLTYPAETDFDGFISESDDSLAPWSGTSVHFMGTDADKCGSPETFEGASLIYRYRLEFAEEAELASIAVSGAAFNGSILRVLDADMNILETVYNSAGNSFSTSYVALDDIAGRVFYVEEYDWSSTWRFRQSIVINGPLPLGNYGSGVFLGSGVSDNDITGNVISGNRSDGIYITEGASQNLVQNNLVGTDVTGSIGLGNWYRGIVLNGGANNNLIAGNVVSANGVAGIRFHDSGTKENRVEGNFVGTDVTGTKPLGNGYIGIRITDDAANNTIDGNTIAFNADSGVTMNGEGTLENTVRSNSIFSNGGFGIDLGEDAITPNDPRDPDTGPNTLQNYPIITSVLRTGLSVTIRGLLPSAPLATFRLEFFNNDSCDPSVSGEGQTFLGFATVKTNPAGIAHFEITLPVTLPSDTFITATATDSAGNTSEFSKCFTPAPGWNLVNDPGFGDPSAIGVLALEVFQDKLYAGAGNWNTGGQVWRLGDDGLWAQVISEGFGMGYESPALLDLVIFQGQLYAGTGWGAAPGQVWRSANGSAWQPVTTDGFGNSENNAVTNFIVFKNMLYAATGNVSGSVQIWRSSTGGSGTWAQVAPDASDIPGNMTGFAIYKGILYAAIEPASEVGAPIQVWRSTDGSAWTIVTSNGFGDERNVSTGGFAQFGGYLYLGTRNDETGAQLWRTKDGVNWEKVVGDGFGDLNNLKIESLIVYNDLLYAVTYNLSAGMQVWRSADGMNWEQVAADGFGDSNNFSTLWNSATLKYQGHLLIGTWNTAEGGELWRFTP